MQTTVPRHPSATTHTRHRRSEAAAYVRQTYNIPCSPRWLAKLAVTGGGPLFCKAGRTPLYDQADLDAWALARIGEALPTASAHKQADAQRKDASPDE